jgi:hypothetical protein
MKYVCVGQPKTGTKTMAKIFDLLNFKVNSNPLCLSDDNDFILLDNDILYYTNDNILKCSKNIDTFDFFHDYPYSFNYEFININFFNSKFILTIRNSEEWFNSLINYQYIKNATNKKFLKKIYGYEIISLENKEEVISKYNEYNLNVIKYFNYNYNNDDSSKLLIIDFSKDDFNNIKNKINNFLKVGINFDIPHENKQEYNNKK